jgi:hypothetical protein
VVQQVLPASAPVLNSNACAIQRWPQQAAPAASTTTAAQLGPSFATHQACAAGPNKSGLPHTPAARCLLQRPAPRQSLQFKRLRSVGASRGQGESGAGSRFLLASSQVNSRSFSRSWPFVASARLLSSNARQAKPAELQRSSFGRLAFSTLRANPSIKRTCLRQAAYVER